MHQNFWAPGCNLQHWVARSCWVAWWLHYPHAAATGASRLDQHTAESDVGRYIDGAIISSPKGDLAGGLASLGAEDGRFLLVEVDLAVHVGGQVANSAEDALCKAG